MDMVDGPNEESMAPDISGDLKDSDALGNELNTAEESKKPDGEICDQELKTPEMFDDPYKDAKVHETVNRQFESSTDTETAHKSATITEDIEPDIIDDDDGDKMDKLDEETKSNDISEKLGVDEISNEVDNEEKSEKCERMICDDVASQLLDDKGLKTPDILKSPLSHDKTDTAVGNVQETLTERFEGSADDESTPKLDMTKDNDLKTYDADKVDGIVEEPKTSDVPDKFVGANELGSEINNEKEPEKHEEVSCGMRDSLQNEDVIKKRLDSSVVLGGPDNVDAVGMVHTCTSLNEVGGAGADSDIKNKVDEKTEDKDTHIHNILDKIGDNLVDKISDTTEEETEEGADVLDTDDNDGVEQSMDDAATDEPNTADSQDVVGDDSEHQQEANSIVEDEGTNSLSSEDVATKVRKSLKRWLIVYRNISSLSLIPFSYLGTTAVPSS